MTDRLVNFFNKEPEKIVEWHDDHSDACGWLVINSLHNGAAGGGTRMRADCTESEIRELAKTMEIKFTVSGPSIGGAKSGIRYNFKDDQDKLDVLGRWFAFIKKELKSCYGTGGDQNIDMVKHVVPTLKSLGVSHPQEGIINGMHPNLSKEERKAILKNLNDGVALKLQKDDFLAGLDFTISDIATGLNVASAVESFYKGMRDTLSNKKVIVEGFGNVGAGAAYFAAKNGARVVGILDKEWCVFNDAGIDVKEMLTLRKNGQLTAGNLEIKANKHESMYPQADIFIPAATSHTIDDQRLKKFEASGISLITPGANNPFVDLETEMKADKVFSVIADFITNSGMARCFSYLMGRDCVVDENAIMAAVVANEENSDVAWVYRQFPLEQLHPVKAMAEAVASECAAELGGNDAFWQFADRFMEITPSNNRTDIDTVIPQIVREIGLDETAFQTCFESGKYDDHIAADIQNAVETGGRGTPWSVLIAPNGKTFPINGAQPQAAVEQLINIARQEQ